MLSVCQVVVPNRLQRPFALYTMYQCNLDCTICCRWTLELAEHMMTLVFQNESANTGVTLLSWCTLVLVIMG